MSNEYRVVVGAKLNGNLCYFDLDICTERSVTSSATIPQFPVQDGVTISDHMYRNPRTLSLTGRFSLAGKSNSEGSNLYTRDHIIGTNKSGEKPWERWFEEDAGELKDLSESNRLESVQKVFEYIQAKGILCTVMMCQTGANDTKTRFKVRDNMALASIRWTEQYNSMGFTLDFTEVITVDTLGSFEVLDSAGDYPSLSLPVSRSLGQVVQDTGTIYDVVIESLFRSNYIAIADGEALRLKGETLVGSTAWSVVHRALQAAIVHVVAGLIVAGVVAGASAIATAVGVSTTTVLASSAGGPIGLAIGLAIAAKILAVSGVIIAITEIQKAARLRRGFNLIQKYDLYVNPTTLEPTGLDLNNATINDPDLVRLQRLIEDVQYAVDTEIQNLAFYSLPEVGDAPGVDVPVQIGVDTIIARINKNETGNPFRMTLIKGFGENAPEITPDFGEWCVEGSLYDMQENTNDIYRDSSRQYHMYLFNPYYDELFTRGMSDDVIAEHKNNLSDYYIVVARGSVKDSMENLGKTIKSALENAGYRE